MEENESREELLHKLDDIEEKIKQIHSAAELSGTSLSMSELISLEAEKEKIAEKLEQVYVKNIEKDVERDEVESREQEEAEREWAEELAREEKERTSEEQEIEEQEVEVGEDIKGTQSKSELTVDVEEKDADKEKNSLGDKQKDEQQVGTNKTFLDWQVESGIDVLADNAIMAKYDKYMTREEFLDIINKENVAKVIREPGRAEEYLKSADDWRAAETSDSALREAEMAGNLPTQSDSDDYIKSVNGGADNKFMDNDKDGRIDQDDIREDEKSEKDDERVKDSDDKVMKKVVKNIISNVEKGEMDSVGASLLFGMKNPEKVINQDNEIDNDDPYEITPPNIRRP